MSNTIAHLAVAKKILSKNITMINNHYAYYLGVISPDTISSKPNYTRNDKKVVHLRDGIADAEWLDNQKMKIFDQRISDFIALHICDSSIQRGQKDFNIGYLVHLLTDKYNHKTIRQSLLKVAKENNVAETDREFFNMCVNDLEALDSYLLNKYTDIGALFLDLFERPAEFSLDGCIEKNYIKKSLDWWQTEYFLSISNRKLKYISEKDIDNFIENASDNIILELKSYNII